MLLLLFICASLGNDEWVVKLDDSKIDPVLFAQREGFVYKGPVDYLPPGFHIFEASSSRKRSVTMGRNEGVMYAKRQEPRFFRTRSVAKTVGNIIDPLFSEQWHLEGHRHAVDIDHVPAGINGTGVSIAIVDDGLQHSHPDLVRRYDAVHSWDFNDNDPDPTPTRSEHAHGTAAGGVAVAERNNGVCGSGAAYGARVVGIRLIAGGVTDLVQSQGLSHNAIANVDIYSCSWGPIDDGRSVEGPDALTEGVLAWNTNGKRGRLGKGSIYVWAAGNGRADGDSCAYDGFASSMYVNAIGAIDHHGNRSWYSEGCAALMAVTPSSGAMRGITTIDLLGNAGYTPTDCTSSFGGTSSAAPLASGLIALVLQVRPDLTWRDVKHVLAKSAVIVDPMDRDLAPRANQRGFRHSYGYGFGALKAPRMIQVARDHKLVPANMSTIRVPMVPTTTMDPHTGAISGGEMPFTYQFNMSAHSMNFIEHVELTVQLQHPRRGSVQIVLVSPYGTESIMAPRRPLDDGTQYGVEGWTFTSVRFWGETITATPNNVWIVRINSNDARYHGIVTGLALAIHGY